MDKLTTEFEAARAAEKRMAAAARGRGPGTCGYEPGIWKEFLAAIQATNEAFRRIREAETQ